MQCRHAMQTSNKLIVAIMSAIKDCISAMMSAMKVTCLHWMFAMMSAMITH
jgi:hypothetical protein